MSLAIRAVAEPMKSLGFASIGAAYMGVGTIYQHAIRILILQNFTDKLVFFSFDGINDHIAAPANSYMIIDLATNKTVPQGFYFAEGSRIYVKAESALPTLGSVYSSAIYGVDL